MIASGAASVRVGRHVSAVGLAVLLELTACQATATDRSPVGEGPSAVAVEEPSECEAPALHVSGEERSAPNDAELQGWPGNTAAPAGVYVWTAHQPNWMHRVSRGVSGLELAFATEDASEGWSDFLERFSVPGWTECEATAIHLAGYDGTFRMTGPRREEWTLDIDGTTVRILLWAHNGSTRAELAEAHAVIGSIDVVPQANEPGFMLTFRLERGWDSG